MQFTLTIKMDGAAFTDQETGDPDPGEELSSILGKLAVRMHEGSLPSARAGSLRDTYGNTCGEWQITDD